MYDAIAVLVLGTEVDAALHLATLTGLLVQPGSANGVSRETQALCVHSPKPVTALGYAPVTGTFEQFRGMGLILENALSPEDPVREIVASRDVPVIAGLAQWFDLPSGRVTCTQGQSDGNKQESTGRSRRETGGNLRHSRTRCGSLRRHVNQVPGPGRRGPAVITEKGRSRHSGAYVRSRIRVSDVCDHTRWRCVSLNPVTSFNPRPRARSSPIWAVQIAAIGRRSNSGVTNHHTPRAAGVE